MGKEKSHEELVKVADKATEARKAARKTLEALATKAGVNPKQVKKGFDHKEHGKELKKLHKAWEEAKAAEEKAVAEAKAAKPASEKATKYEYPADVITDADKKKYRAKMRAAKAKAEKGEEADKPAKAKKEKAEKGSEKPAKEDKADKPSKKDKKAKKAKEEDED